MAVFPVPVVFEASDWKPMAVFPIPVVLHLNAL